VQVTSSAPALDLSVVVDPTAGVKIDLAPFVGKEYLLQVENTANGNGTRISTVMPGWSK
jgi:hypothetical protein